MGSTVFGSSLRRPGPFLGGMGLALATMMMACSGGASPDLGAPTPTSAATAAPTAPAMTDAPTDTQTPPPPTPTSPSASTPTSGHPPTQPPATPACLDNDRDGYCGAADCNDANPSAYPGAPELCDSRDNDCDSLVDEVDADQDGWSDCTYDCDPSDPQTNPGGTESCDSRDNDCDTRIDEGFDQDGDGYSSCGGGALDCDDTSSAVNPGAVEVCNTRDDNCNGVVDEGVGSAWYLDEDGDGYGETDDPILACQRPTGHVAQGGDCDDSDASTYPGAAELCDGLDNNCSGGVLDESPLSTWYVDADGDGFGASGGPVQACAAPPGYVDNNEDCDDTSGSAFPGGEEVCDGLDNDCDGPVDEGLNQDFYLDLDGDGFGDGSQPVSDCSQCNGACSTDGTDCNDGDALIYPGAPELADGKDNDCDGEAEAAVSLSDAAATITGTSPSGGFGRSIAGPGDLDGDGYDDLVIAAPQGGANRAGTAFVFYGRGGDWGHVNDLSAQAILTVDETASQFGASITGGDIDANGAADLMIGAPAYNALGWENSGIVFVLYGGERIASQTLAATNPRTVFIAGYTPEVSMGASVDAGGDITGDGIDDLLIGAPWPWLTQVPPVAGITFILPGKTGSYTTAGGIGANNLVQLYGERNQVLGATVRHTGDIDGDGYGDFIGVGRGKQGSAANNYTDGGIAYAIRGGSASIYTPGTLTALQVGDHAMGSWLGDTQGDMVGQWVAGPGDINGDGKADFVLGRQAAKTAEPMAMVFLTPLPASGAAESNATTLITSSAQQSPCPCAVGGIGDYDGDGLGDFAVAGLGNAGGQIFIFYGHGGAWNRTLIAEDDANLIFGAEALGDSAGVAITPLGDLNGDGNDDFAIGASGVDAEAGTDVGRVYLFFGF